MGRLLAKHPLTIFLVVPNDQGVLDTDERTFDKMKKVAFESIDETADESSIGFVVLENYRSTNFSPGVVEFGEYVVGSVRLDMRKVPKAALDKLHDDYLDAEKDKNKENGIEHIAKDRRKELRELAALKLRAKVPPTPKVVDFWWNTKTGLAFLTDKSKVAVDAFIGLFRAAFGPGYELRAVEITNILPNAAEVEVNVGLDMLTWLWGCRSKGSAFLASRVPFTAYIDGKVSIASNHEKMSATCDGGEDTFAEIDAGIKFGKRVSKALIKFEYGEGNEHWCIFELDAKLLPILEVSIPNAKCTPGSDFEGALMQQIGNLEEAFNRLRLLFVCYATQFNPEAIGIGISQPQLMELRDTPDTISGYLNEGDMLISIRDNHYIIKPVLLDEDAAA